MILRFFIRILIAFGFLHSLECDGRIHRVKTQFGTREVCDKCNYSILIDRNAGEG